MAETPPDRLSTDPRSPYFDAKAIERDVGVRFKGVEKTNVAEYCVSEGWIRVEAAKTKDRYGNPLLIKLSGPVEAYFKDKEKNDDKNKDDGKNDDKNKDKGKNRVKEKKDKDKKKKK
jgi:hypothetical protein